MHYASLVGRQNVSAATGSGMSWVHRKLCGATLQLVVEGTALASADLWG